MIYLIAYMIGCWLMVMTISYHIYATAKYNHFMFKYWFAIGFFTVLQLVLGAYYVLGIETSLQSARWLLFIFIDILLIEIFVTTIISRIVELLARVGMYSLIFAAHQSGNDIHLVILAVTLAYLASISHCMRIRIFFTPVFILYAAANAAPTIFGATTLESLGVGAIYSTVAVTAIHQIYAKKCRYNSICKSSECTYEKRE